MKYTLLTLGAAPRPAVSGSPARPVGTLTTSLAILFVAIVCAPFVVLIALFRFRVARNICGIHVSQRITL
jgi:hypothetical protein